MDDMLREGDTLVVWKLDRLARSLRHLIELAETLKGRGIVLVSLADAIDTGSPSGILVFHMLGAIAEFERALIRERTEAGLSEARRRGRKGGRPKAMTAKDVIAARAMLQGRDVQVSDVPSASASRGRPSTATSPARAEQALCRRQRGDGLMPIRRQHRWLYPIDRPQLSNLDRSQRAKGRGSL